MSAKVVAVFAVYVVVVSSHVVSLPTDLCRVTVPTHVPVSVMLNVLDDEPTPVTRIADVKVFCAAIADDTVCPVAVIRYRPPTDVDLNIPLEAVSVISPEIADAAMVVGVILAARNGPSSHRYSTIPHERVERRSILYCLIPSHATYNMSPD